MIVGFLHYLSFEFHLWKLQRGLKKIHRIFAELFDKAKREKATKEHLWSLRDEYGYEATMINDHISDLISSYWRNAARRLNVRLPSSEDKTMWEEIYSGQVKCLSELGVEDLKKRVRDEAIYYRDAWAFASGLVIGAVGMWLKIKA